MEETLGKRIAYHRKRLGFTQDKLAELLGVTAQAVSKWENDQSCPDINLLPKLAELFGITTDELLGVKKEETVHTAEIVTDEDPSQEPEDGSAAKGDFELHWNSGRKGSIGLALWVLLTGGLILYSMAMNHYENLWDILWPTGVLLFGLFGLYPDFSIFRLGCALFGGFYLVNNVGLLSFSLTGKLLLPFFLLLFGLSLLIDALRKPKRKHGFTVHRGGKAVRKSTCTLDAEGFRCEGCFGEGEHLIQLPRLSSGAANLSFGSMTVDLSGCNEVAEDCRLELNCSFGELTLLVPRRFRVVPQPSTAFGNVELKGAPAPDAQGAIYASCDVSFGEITLRYI